MQTMKKLFDFRYLFLAGHSSPSVLSSTKKNQ